MTNDQRLRTNHEPQTPATSQVMHIAWFRTRSSGSREPEAVAQLIAALGARHTIDVIDEMRAHDAVWRRNRERVDLNVYELDDTARSRFIWPYLVRYPGLTLLLASTLMTSRTATLLTDL